MLRSKQGGSIMNKGQLANLNASLKKAFSAVSSDISKLNKKNSKLHEELDTISRKVSSRITNDEFYKLIKHLEDELSEKVDRDLLKSSEEQIKLRAEEIISIPNKNIKIIESSIETLKANIKTTDKKKEQELKKLQQEIKKSEQLKQEVKEVRNLKKYLLNLDKKFATKKKIETCFEEIDEVYDLIEELDTKSLRQTSLDSFKKEVNNKLKKFEKRVDDVEEIEEELHKKTKDIYSYEKKIESFKKEMIFLKQRIKVLENTPQIDYKPQIEKTNVSLLHEINKIDLKIINQNTYIKDIMQKMNELVKIVNNEIGQTIPIKKMYESKLSEEEHQTKKIKAKIKRIEKKYNIEDLDVPTPNKNKRTSRNELPEMPLGEPKKKSIWSRIADWFTEEIDEDEEDDEDNDDDIELKIVKTKKQNVSSVKKRESKTQKKESKSQISKKTKDNEEDKEESKKSFWSKIVDWFTEEIDDEEEE